MDAATLTDRGAPEPVLVIGSPPPSGRDLDLLVRPPAHSVLAEILTTAGFHHRRGHVWVRFDPQGPDIVELIPADSLGLTPGQLDALFAGAESIPGYSQLQRPATHHRLLLLARRIANEARIDEKRRRAAAEADFQAWSRARQLAPTWGAAAELAELERGLQGKAPRSWRWRLAIERVRRYRKGAVISISGLDGAGKSTQVECLADTLRKLGYPTVTVWTSVAAHPSLSKLAAPARAWFGQRRNPEGVEELWPPAGEDDDPLTQLRERRPMIQAGWVSIVAAMNAWWQARAVRPHLLRGRIVICDRYTLDSIVHLRYRYGPQRRYRFQLMLIRLLSPAPLCAYLLDVDAKIARSRRREYTLAQNELRMNLYREQYAELSVERLDGTRDRDDLATEIALRTWSALCATRDDARPLVARAILAALRPLDRR